MNNEEARIQMELMEYVKTGPNAKLLYTLHHIPNGEKRNITTAIKLSKMGVLAGVCDLFLPKANEEYHGLYIEVKRTKGGVLSPKQHKFIEEVESAGYKVETHTNAWVAYTSICGYIGVETGPKRSTPKIKLIEI